MTRAGVAIKEQLSVIQESFGSKAPLSLSSFYKYYRKDIDKARAETVEQVGSKVVQQALEGDFKSQELFLRSKGGWSPTSTVREGEDLDEVEETENALEVLTRLLGESS